MKLRRKEPSGSSGRPPSSAARRGCRSRGSRTCRGLAGGDRPPGLGGAPGRPGRAGAFPIPGFRGVVPEEKGERAPAPFSTSGKQAPADAGPGPDPFRPPEEAGATEAGKRRADRRREAAPLVHSSRRGPPPAPGRFRSLRTPGPNRHPSVGAPAAFPPAAAAAAPPSEEVPRWAPSLRNRRPSGVADGIGRRLPPRGSRRDADRPQRRPPGPVPGVSLQCAGGGAEHPRAAGRGDRREAPVVRLDSRLRCPSLPGRNGVRGRPERTGPGNDRSASAGQRPRAHGANARAVASPPVSASGRPAASLSLSRHFPPAASFTGPFPARDPRPEPGDPRRVLLPRFSGDAPSLPSVEVGIPTSPPRGEGNDRPRIPRFRPSSQLRRFLPTYAPVHPFEDDHRTEPPEPARPGSVHRAALRTLDLGTPQVDHRPVRARYPKTTRAARPASRRALRQLRASPAHPASSSPSPRRSRRAYGLGSPSLRRA